MKKVLLTTTAMAFAASMASAGDMAMSGSIALTYGAFGTGTAPGGADDFTSEANLNIAGTSSGGNISVSGTLELDESSFAGGDTGNGVGAVTISTGALTFTYDNDDLGALALAPTGGDGEDDNYGDYSVAFAAGGIGVTYTKDQDSSDNVMGVSYAAGALTLSLTALDESAGTGAGTAAAVTGLKKTTVGATYVTGPYTIAISGDDQDDQDWDASVAMAAGDTTVTVAADETNMMSVGIGYTNGALTLSARQEFNNAAGDDSETEVSLSYTEGAMTFSVASDSGQGTAAAPTYGDEAAMLISAAYVDGDVTVAAKGTDQDEMEVSVTFAF